MSVGKNTLKGFCATSSPDEIQACIWKVDTVDGTKSKAAQPRVHIEF